MVRALVAFLLISFSVAGQDLDIRKGWKFKTGDQQIWATPNFNDSGWTPIQVGKYWERQGFDGYNGFAWYRLHIFIPSSIREKSFLREKLRFDLGMIDDGDEVYLNGSLIGKNAGRSNNIQEGPYDAQRSYYLVLNDYRIHWDQENVIAVRVWDGGGDGGMYDGKYGISASDVIDYIVINKEDHDFKYSADKKLAKEITLQSTSDKYDFTGKLRITVTDPASGVIVYKQTLGVDFAKSRPFSYAYTFNLPENKTYQANYYFTEDRSHKEIIASESTPYLLTPHASNSPKINGPGVYGVRPHSSFQYKIPASGEKPMSFEVTGLPAGLQLDKQTGIITGSLSAKGNYTVKLLAKNKVGSTSKNLKIICGDLIGITPALGWNSWNCWGLSVSDEKVKISAKAMFEKLADYGWTYINIDDGWQDKRNEKGEMLPNNKFPDMKSLSAYVHGLGLKLGIYSSPGTKTCGAYAGSYQHEDQDAITYADWGIDYLKYDWCSYGEIAPAKPSLDDYKKPYFVMRSSLNKVNRDILYSLCQYGMGDVWKWGAEVGGNSWRTTGDIVDTWSSLSEIGFSQYKSSPNTQPGHFNDPDMLIVGKVGWGPKLHSTRLSPDEQYTHISLWSLLSAPLLIGCDIGQLDDFTLNLLTNDEVLAIDQDALAKPAIKTFEKNQIQVWTKELEDGSKAIGIFNLSDSIAKPTISFTDLHIAAQQKLRDVWSQKDIGVYKNNLSISIPSHGVVLLKAKSNTATH